MRGALDDRDHGEEREGCHGQGDMPVAIHAQSQ
jgi:hypothetical protein